MPPIIIAVVAAAATAATAAGLTGAVILGVTISATTAMIAGAVVGAVVAAGLGMAFAGSAPKARPLDAAATDQKIMIRGSVAPRRVIYGEAKVSGPILYAASTGPNLEHLHLVVALAGHSVHLIDTVWINDVPIYPSDITDGTVTNGKFAGKIMIGKYDGHQTTAESQLMLQSPDGWDANHKLLGVAYIYVRLTYDPNLFQGLPNISARVFGKDDILDPRTNTTGYTTNWALCVLDYLRADFGLACAADELDADSFIAAANLSDELVPLDAGGGTVQPRYTANGSFTLDAAPIKIMEDLLGAGAGALVYVAGQYRLHGGAYIAPSDSLGVSDFAGPVEVQTMPPRESLFNGVQGTFIDPERFYQPSEFPPLQDPTALAEDGEPIWRDIELPFVTDVTRAQRLARQTLYRTRNPLTVRAPLRYSSVRFSIWQTVAVTLPDLGWSAKPFRIAGFSFSAADGGCTVTLTEEQVASYAWLYDQAIAVPDSPNTTLIDPLTIPAPTNLLAVVSTAAQADGSIAPALDVSWTPAAHAFVIAHEIQWKAPGGEWLSRDVPMPTAFAALEPVVSGVAYSIRVRATTGLARGPWSAEIAPTAGADTVAPAVPTGVTATGVLRGVALSWAQPADRDLAAIEVFEAPTTATSGRVQIGETLASTFLRTGMPPDTTRQYWLRSRDRTGNRSAYVGPIAGTSSALLTTDIGAGIIDTAKFASGIAPVVLIPNLSTAAADNTTALNTADGKLYTRVGGVWVATVQPLGPAGTLTSAQIQSLDAIKVLGTLSGANLDATRLLGQIGNTQVAAGAITASKLTLVPASLNVDPYFQDAAAWGVDAAGWTFETRATGNTTDLLAVPAGVVLKTPGFTGTGSKFVTANARIPVTPGEPMALRAKAKNGGNRAISVLVGFLDAADAFLGQIALTWAAGAAASYQETQGVVPAGAAKAYLQAFNAAGATAWTGAAAVSDIMLERPNTAAMVVDGAISAGKIAAGAVTTSHLSVGSANLIWNSTATRTTDGWLASSFGGVPAPVLAAAKPAGSAAWVPRDVGGGYLRIPSAFVGAGAGAVADWRPDPNFLGASCLAGDKMQARALLGSHRCAALLELLWFNASNAEISRVASTPTTSPAGGLNDTDFASHTILAVAPAGTVLALLRITLQGNGGSDPYVFFSKLVLGKAPPNATEVGAWDPGGVTDLSGGQLRTGSVVADVIATNAITAGKIAADAVTAGTVAAGAINAREIAAGAIRADKLASEEIISDSIQVRNLVIGTTKITGNAVTDIQVAAQSNTASLTSPTNPGDMFLQWAMASVNVTVPAGSDGKVLVTVNPNVGGTTNYVWNTAGGGGGGSPGGGQ